MVKIVNLRCEKYDVYIGRGSVWGNKFVIGRDGNREEVIEKYRIWFEERIEKDDDFKKRTLGLRGKLGCYCKPLNCHGDVIKKYLEKESVR